MKIYLSLKTKCVGCKALQYGRDGYSCLMGHSISFSVQEEKLSKNIVNKVPYAPKPAERCYKPKSDEQIIEAKKLIDAKPVNTHTEKRSA